ncbi:MAG TPA: phosphoribosyltransferase [Firmicutes bacterium]|nr:phosphoribosyltransferase [Candidatus Fermentithermobacillaceae bacterium]
MYRDRTHAGEVLASLLTEWRGYDPLVLGVPRGGVIVASVVAASLEAHLDVIVSRKVGAPGNPEFAVAAVDPDGELFVDPESFVPVSPEYLERAAAAERLEISRRLRLWRGNRQEPLITGRIVIMVDDGIATGLTAMAALTYLRRKSPSRLVLAVPVAPADTVAKLERYADEVVCPLKPSLFFAVGEWYEDFTQVTDEEVIKALARHNE